MRLVLFKTIFDVVGFGFNRHPDAHTDVVGNHAAVFFKARDHLNHAFAFQHTTFADRTRDIRNIFDTRGWIEQTVRRHT